ncbi:response regulator [Pararhizobium sp. IMCC21322]|uniref:response regulator n=1 Tax=Pararhizobium sp. IMCC21322 TaxID=3067903 RepID=UPI002741986C|nr:response regulator [Pararhizobium sp. IMCC21322]
MRILIVEDDTPTAEFIERGLQELGHVVDRVSNGKDGVIYALEDAYDLAVIDRMLPGLDGVSIVKSLRGSGSSLPIILLTAMGGVDDRVEGLEAGADDYLVKPFAFSELMARINALSRRPSLKAQITEMHVADLTLDLVRRTTTRSGQNIDLKSREFAVLEVLMRNEGRVVTRTMLLEQVWDFNFLPQTSVVETLISRLRAKIDKPFDTPLLHTIRNTGYSVHAPR